MTEEAVAEGGSLFDRSPLFCHLDAETRSCLLSGAHRRNYVAGDVIFLAGTPGQSMMAVLKGTVRICITSPQGKELVLADIPTGEFFGELALLDGSDRAADALALSNCQLLVLDRRDVLPVLKRDPNACLKMMQVMSARLRRTDESLGEIAFFDLRSRLAKALLRASSCDAVKNNLASSSKLASSQRELATMIGATRESVNRCLQEWRRRDIIRMRDGWIVIVDRDALERAIGVI